MRNSRRFFVRCLLLSAVGAALWTAAHRVPALGAPAPAGAQSTDHPSLSAQAHAALSVTQGKIKLSGLHHPVSVLRDRWGVPHIYAQDQHDLFFAQGFVASQDRLFQMELWKRLGQGRLAEIVGPSMLQRDVSARLLHYRGDMAAEYASYSPDALEILKAFTDGINACIRNLSEPGGPGLPLEFRLARFSPEPWKPEDCASRTSGYNLTGASAASELYHAQLAKLLGAEGAARLLDLDPVVRLDPPAGLDLNGLSASILPDLPGGNERLEFPPEPLGQGSNNWTISGRLTRTGRPLLAADPHRSVAEPSVRYIVHLVAPGWDVIGAAEPGLPGVTLGHNQRVAWGITAFTVDQQDLYLETVDPADPLRYKTETGWERMQVEEETVRVKGQPDAKVQLKFTRHGPVLWEDPPRHRVLVLRWAGTKPGTAGYLASLALDRVQNWDQFEAAMPRWKVPPANIVYADVEGNIGEHSMGLTPIRKNWTGQLPVPGDQGFEWAGFIPPAELPHQFNPAAGFIATANHKTIPPNYPYMVGNEWSPYRFPRIHEVLSQAAAGGRKLGVEDMVRLQNDVVSLPARQLKPLLAHAAGEAPDAPVRLLLNWNCSVDRNSAAASLYEVWIGELQRAVYHLLAPEDAWKIVEGHWSLPVTMRNLEHPGEATFGPSPTQARDHLLMSTLHTAVDKLTVLEGPDPAQWSWGKIHVIHFRHPLGRLPGAAALMNLGPLARSGDGFTVCSTFMVGPGYEQAGGASYRQIFDPADWDRSRGINVPGESAQPGSPHYGDLLPLWIEGRYFPLLYSRPAVEKETTDRLLLEP